MADSFKFPDHPLSGQRDPFKDSDGQNPFADSEQTEISETTDIYATPEGTVRAPEMGDYLTTGKSRGLAMMVLGILGMLFGLFAFLGVSVILFSPATSFLRMGVFELIIISLIGVSMSLGAWIASRGDLKAMAFGAIESTREGMTRVGFWLGFANTLISIVVYVGLLVLWIARIAGGG